MNSSLSDCNIFDLDENLYIKKSQTILYLRRVFMKYKFLGINIYKLEEIIFILEIKYNYYFEIRLIKVSYLKFSL